MHRGGREHHRQTLGALSVMETRLFWTLAMLTGAGLAVAVQAHAHASSAWPVYELTPGPGCRDESMQVYEPALSLTSGYRQSIHVAYVTPGRAYRLGLRLSSPAEKNVTVSLYDRWPHAEGAKSFPLSMGGGLRDRGGGREYQWWFSIDRESSGSLLYVVVTIDPGFSGTDDEWSYWIFIVDSPDQPMNKMGRGVVYQRGPSSLKLWESTPSVPLRYVGAYRIRRDSRVCERWQLPDDRHSNLVRNGDFRRGLSLWRLQPEGAEGVGVVDGRLRLWSREASSPSGVVQQMDANIAGRRVRLEMDLMISAQAEPARPGWAPLMLSLCYEDTGGSLHCGESAFHKYFTILRDAGESRSRNEVVLPPGAWSRYAVGLDELIPQPRRLISIGLSGAGAPEREAWVERLVIRPDIR